MNNRVFWCHSSLDKNSIAPYKSIIERIGFYSIYDEQHLLPGMYFEDFYKKIDSCHYFIACCSVHLLNSKAAIKEIEICKRNSTIKLIPILIEEVGDEMIKQLEHLLGEMLFAHVYDRHGLNKLEHLFEQEKKVISQLPRDQYFLKLKENLTKDRIEVITELMNTIMTSVNDETTKRLMVNNLLEVSNKLMEINEKKEKLDKEISSIIDEVKENCHQQSITIKLL